MGKDSNQSSFWYNILFESFKKETDFNAPIEYFKLKYNLLKDDIKVSETYFIKNIKEHIDRLLVASEEVCNTDCFSDVSYQDALLYLRYEAFLEVTSYHIEKFPFVYEGDLEYDIKKEDILIIEGDHTIDDIITFDILLSLKKSLENYKVDDNQGLLDNLNTQKSKSIKKKKISEKFFGLYHLFLIHLRKERKFETDDNDEYDKEAIIKFGKKIYEFETQGQVFYKTVTKVNLNDKVGIANDFKRYKDIIIDISNNDVDIITMLKKWPN